MTDPVREYYASFHERELNRLLTAEGRLEFTLTTRLLRPHLPDGGRVLDIGGGPGRYAAWLAGEGFDVSLADLSPNLLELARRHLAGKPNIREIVEADARDLSRWPDATFAATLALGPFYHLPDERDRQRAWDEVVRVTIPGGLVAIALMPRWQLVRRTLSVPDERRRLADPEFVSALLERGEYTNLIPGRFNHGYGADPARLGDDDGRILLASTHGFASGLEDAVDELRRTDPAAYQAVLDLLTRTATDPGLLATAGHLLHLARTPRVSGVSARLDR
jgi:SAM-dependent methyltransferase